MKKLSATCKWCKTRYEKERQKQICCSVECAENYANKIRSRSEQKERLESRKTIRLKKEQLKTRSQWMKEAQSAFNAYIRERDKNQSCICCGRPLGESKIGGAYDCGHYRSVGSSPNHRFNEDNAHAQRKQCNRYGAGRAVDYRIGLIARIGVDRVEALESDNEPRKYSIDDLKNIIQCYKLKIKELKCKTENSPQTQ